MKMNTLSEKLKIDNMIIKKYNKGTYNIHINI